MAELRPFFFNFFHPPVNEVAQGDARSWSHLLISHYPLPWNGRWLVSQLSLLYHRSHSASMISQCKHSDSVTVLMLVWCSCLLVIGNGGYEKVTLFLTVCVCVCAPLCCYIFMRLTLSSEQFCNMRAFWPVLTPSNVRLYFYWLSPGVHFRELSKVNEKLTDIRWMSVCAVMWRKPVEETGWGGGLGGRWGGGMG